MTDQTPETGTETQAGAETAGGEQAQESQPDILGQINETLSQFGQQLPNQIAQQIAEQQQYYGYEDQQQDQYGQQDQYQQQEDPYGGLDPNDPRDAALIQARNELNELKQGFQGTQRDMWSRDLEGVLGEYPEIRDNPEVAKAVMDNLTQMGVDVNSMVNPKALVMAYKAHKSDEYAKQQQPLDQAQQQGVTLESSAAQQQEPEQDEAQRLFGAPEQRNPVFGWAQR